MMGRLAFAKACRTYYPVTTSLVVIFHKMSQHNLNDQFLNLFVIIFLAFAKARRTYYTIATSLGL